MTGLTREYFDEKFEEVYGHSDNLKSSFDEGFSNLNASLDHMQSQLGHMQNEAREALYDLNRRLNRVGRKLRTEIRIMKAYDFVMEPQLRAQLRERELMRHPSLLVDIARCEENTELFREEDLPPVTKDRDMH